MDQRSFDALELNALIGLLAGYIQTPMGKQRVLLLRPSGDRAAILQNLDLTSECVNYRSKGEKIGLGGLEDPEPALEQLQIEGTHLDPLQIFALEYLVSVGIGFRERFQDSETRRQYPNLARITADIPDLRPLVKLIHGKILPDGTLDDDASPELRAIRREIYESRTRIHRKLESILQSQEHAVRDEIVTFRNDRFVIPIRTDSRGKVPGVVHGLSSSGQTTFIEPLSVIDQNNELVRWREQEVIEIANILLSLTNALRSNLPALRVIAKAVEEIDFAQAKARFAAEYDCARPQISDDGSLSLEDARHILLEHALRQSGANIVPISLKLDGHSRVLLISGPNAGGKTVVIKTVGLIALMAQMGLHVPARAAVLPVFDQIFADIGDHQSIAANLSTFTAHMRNIAETALKIKPPALVLMDELGTGTDPDEGASLAIAIVDFFLRAGAMTIATTHYPALKMWASQTSGVVNASVEFDERTLRPTFRLILGIAGASSGIEIARRMNLPPSILDAAQGLIEPSHAQARAYLKQLKEMVDEQVAQKNALEQERIATAEKYGRLDLEFAKRETARRAEFDDSLARVLQQFNEESARLLKSVQDRVEAGRIKKAAANRASDLRRMGEKLRSEVVSDQDDHNDRSAPSARSTRIKARAADVSHEIRTGDRVRIPSLDQTGLVESIHDKIYTVMVGSLRFRSPREELEPAMTSSDQNPAPTVAPRSSSSGPSIDDVFMPELNVIGLNADEAIAQVDKYLDQALLAGVEHLRIIHGHGKGILRRAIAELLTHHAQVESFGPAPSDKGGSGATLVEMRK